MSQRIRKGIWLLAFLTTLVGIGAAAYLTYQHYLHLSSTLTGKSFCNLSTYLNCDLVLTSRYARIGTLPLAGLGLIFYVYVAGALLYARLAPENYQEILSLPTLLAMLSILLSLFLAYVSYFELHALCVFCLSLYLVNLILALALWTLLGRGGPVEIFRKIPWGKALLYFGIVYAIGGIILHTNHKQYAKELSKSEVQDYLNQFMAQTPKTIDVSGKPYWGNPDAKIVIAEFSDMECPYCKVAAFNLKPLLGEYRDKVKLVFMNYPLDKACNPAIQRDLHQQACSAAYATHCAGEQGKFWEYHDAAFDRQPKFSDDSLLAIARKLKLDMKAFESCLGSETTKKAVGADVALGNQIGVNGTPAVYINGRPLPNWINRQILQGAVERSLGGK